MWGSVEDVIRSSVDDDDDDDDGDDVDVQSVCLFL